MVKYIIKRLLWMIPIVLGVTVLVFTLMCFTPGNPAETILGATGGDDSAGVRSRNLTKEVLSAAGPEHLSEKDQWHRQRGHNRHVFHSAECRGRQGSCRDDLQTHPRNIFVWELRQPGKLPHEERLNHPDANDQGRIHSLARRRHTRGKDHDPKQSWKQDAKGLPACFGE